MVRALVRRLSAALLIVLTATPAHAQTSASLTGVVSDTTGAVVPGAAVSVTSTATNVTVEGVTNSAGQFSFPALPVGTYRVTVSLAGFKTSVANDVRVLGAQPTDLSVTLAVGVFTDRVDVNSRNELVQTQSATVTSTLHGEQLRELPLSSRNALHTVMLLPGVSTTRSPKEALINGLSSEAVTITIDGVATTNMRGPLEGLVSMVTPRLDAVEEVTVTGAVPGAGSGRGSVQVAITTRAGSNRTDGSLYHYWRDPRLNSNYFFNRVNKLPRNKVILHQYGFRQGGPILLPGLYDGRGKAFFFFNFENQHQPTSVNRTRSLLRPEAQAGVFGYNVNIAGVQQRRTVDLTALARANGQIAAFDPTVARLLQEIRQATTTTGRVNDTGTANLLQYIYQSEATSNQNSPTGRIDVKLSDRHLLSGAYWWQRFTSTSDLPGNTDAAWPGLPNYGAPNWYPNHCKLNIAFVARTQSRELTCRRVAMVSQPPVLQRHHRPVRQPGRMGFDVSDQHVADSRHFPQRAQHYDLEHRQYAELAAGRTYRINRNRLCRASQP